MLRYFIKDFKVHKRPTPNNCSCNYVGERLLRTPPLSFERCADCFPEIPKWHFLLCNESTNHMFLKMRIGFHTALSRVSREVTRDFNEWLFYIISICSREQIRVS